MPEALARHLDRDGLARSSESRRAGPRGRPRRVRRRPCSRRASALMPARAGSTSTWTRSGPSTAFVWPRQRGVGHPRRRRLDQHGGHREHHHGGAGLGRTPVRSRPRGAGWVRRGAPDGAGLHHRRRVAAADEAGARAPRGRHERHQGRLGQQQPPVSRTGRATTSRTSRQDANSPVSDQDRHARGGPARPAREHRGEDGVVGPRAARTASSTDQAADPGRDGGQVQTRPAAGRARGSPRRRRGRPRTC